jgi:glyoxylase-like metal-dependent hydrolase (beta-lactamase superfamily II)
MIAEAKEKKSIGADVFSVATGVWGRKDLFVNYYFIQDENSRAWALVDAGLKWSASKIKDVARQLFDDQPPVAILLTHGHFDHVGAVATLAAEWNVPVYAHALELPYLTGVSSYPPADPTVGGGAMSTMSWSYPRGPIDIHQHVRSLPDDNSVPGLADWKYVHTPGHSPGHVSLFRERDKTLIAGDAFVTTQAESAFFALSYKKRLSGPPKYYTCNWASAKISVLKLAALDPEIVATGHGYPMYGGEMRNALNQLASRFDTQAVPSTGRYVNEPAVTDETGVLYLPPAAEKIPMAAKVIGISLAVAAIGIIAYRVSRKTSAPANTKNLVDALNEPIEKLKSLRTNRFKTLERAFAK